MIMNVVPASFVTDFNGAGMFVYVLVTDVHTTIPFIINGVELIHSSRLNSKVVIANLAANDTLATFQVWASHWEQCRGRAHFHVTGIDFFCVAVIELVTGLALETWAHRIKRWRIRNCGKGQMEGPFASAMLRKTSGGFFRATEAWKEDSYEGLVALVKRRGEDREPRQADSSFNSSMEGMTCISLPSTHSGIVGHNGWLLEGRANHGRNAGCF